MVYINVICQCGMSSELDNIHDRATKLAPDDIVGCMQLYDDMFGCLGLTMHNTIKQILLGLHNMRNTLDLPVNMNDLKQQERSEKTQRLERLFLNRGIRQKETHLLWGCLTNADVDDDKKCRSLGLKQQEFNAYMASHTAISQMTDDNVLAKCILTLDTFLKNFCWMEVTTHQTPTTYRVSTCPNDRKANIESLLHLLLEKK